MMMEKAFEPKVVPVIPVKVSINAQEQTEQTLYDLAVKDGVGRGGVLLSESIVEQIRQITYDKCHAAYSYKDLRGNLDTLIDIAAGEAVRDVIIRAIVLKRQLSANKTRQEQLQEIIDRMGWIKGASQFGKPPSLEGAIFAGMDELEMQEKMSDDMAMFLQEWIEEDNIEGAYSEEIVFHCLQAEE